MFNNYKNEETYTTLKKRLSIAAWLCLAAAFYPLANSLVSGLFYFLDAIINPLASAGVAIIYSFAIIKEITVILGALADYVQNKLSSLQERASINSNLVEPVQTVEPVQANKQEQPNVLLFAPIIKKKSSGESSSKESNEEKKAKKAKDKAEQDAKNLAQAIKEVKEVHPPPKKRKQGRNSL